MLRDTLLHVEQTLYQDKTHLLTFFAICDERAFGQKLPEPFR